MDKELAITCPLCGEPHFQTDTDVGTIFMADCLEAPVAIVVHDDGDWRAVSPDGYFSIEGVKEFLESDVGRRWLNEYRQLKGLGPLERLPWEEKRE